MTAQAILKWIWEYLEGQGDLGKQVNNPITHIVTLVIPIVNLVTKSQWPSK